MIQRGEEKRVRTLGKRRAQSGERLLARKLTNTEFGRWRGGREAGQQGSSNEVSVEDSKEDKRQGGGDAED